MKIIVLGASGQIGSAIYRGLHNSHDVTGTSRKPSRSHQRFDPFTDEWSRLGKADVLINCVGQIDATSTNSFYRVHVELPKLMIAQREIIGNPKIIQMSALGASANHKVEFLRTKGIADDLLLKYPDTFVIRPSIVCTPGTMIVGKMLLLSKLAKYTRGRLFLPKGFLQTKIQPLMISDLVDLVIAVCNLGKPGIINAVGPLSMSFQDILMLMEKARNQKFKTIEIPKSLTDLVVLNFVSRLFPQLLNSQQYQLLFADNVEDSKVAQHILLTPLLSARDFFLNEFHYASH